MRTRIMKAKAFSIFLRRRSAPQVAVVLQVHAVELHELLVVLDDRAGDLLGQVLRERAAQIAARFLDAFVAREFLGIVRSYRRHGAFRGGALWRDRRSLTPHRQRGPRPPFAGEIREAPVEVHVRQYTSCR